MADDERKYARREPAESAEDWADIWSGVDRAHKAWPVAKGLTAIVEYWKILRWVIVLAFIFGASKIATALGIAL